MDLPWAYTHSFEKLTDAEGCYGVFFYEKLLDFLMTDGSQERLEAAAGEFCGFPVELYSSISMGSFAGDVSIVYFTKRELDQIEEETARGNRLQESMVDLEGGDDGSERDG